MATGDQFIHFAPNRLLGVQDFRERLTEYVRGLVSDIHDVAFGLDGVFGGVPITMSAFGANRIQLDNDATCSDGAGHFLETDAPLAYRDIGLQFENSNAIVYSVGLHFETRPRGVQVNPREARPEFVGEEETIGNRAEPLSVVNNGDGTMTFNVNPVADPFSTTVRTHAGRKCLVWKKIPGETATTEARAIEECIVAFAGGNNTITTSAVGVGGAGTFGQAAPSTNPSDYFVLMVGPTVTRETETDLDLEAGYTFIGTVTGNGGTPTVFDVSQQNDLSSGFAVDINDITRGPVNGQLKVSVQAHPLDAEENQLEARNSGGTVVWGVDEDGDQLVEGNLTVNGTANINALQNLDVLDTANIGSAEADLHTLRGQLDQRDDLNAIVAQLLATGELGLLGAATAGQALVAHGPVQLRNQVLIGQDLNTGVEANAETTRVDFGTLNTTSTRNPIAQWVDSSGRVIRIYGGSGAPAFEITFNARWDEASATWIADDTAGRAQSWRWTQTGLTVRVKHVTTTAWADTGWDADADGTTSQLDFYLMEDFGSAPYKIAGKNIEIEQRLSRLGFGLRSTAGDMQTSRMTVIGPAADLSSGGLGPTYTGLLDFVSSVANRANFKMFMKQNLSASPSPTDGLWIVQNATWNGAAEDWTQVDVDQPSLAIHVSTFNFNPATEDSYIRILRRDPEGAFTTWTDGDWSEQVRFTDQNTTGDTDARIIYNSQFAGLDWGSFVDSGVSIAKGNPDVGTTGLSNTLRAKNLTKAWAVVSIAAGVPTLVDGYGVTSTVTVIGNDIGINLASGNAVDDITDAGPFASVKAGGPVHLQAGMPISTSQIRVSAWDTAGASINLNDAGTTMTIVVGLLAQQSF